MHLVGLDAIQGSCCRVKMDELVSLWVIQYLGLLLHNNLPLLCTELSLLGSCCLQACLVSFIQQQLQYQSYLCCMQTWEVSTENNLMQLLFQLILYQIQLLVWLYAWWKRMKVRVALLHNNLRLLLKDMSSKLAYWCSQACLVGWSQLRLL